MHHNHRRLFDESVVQAIMAATALRVGRFIGATGENNPESLGDFIDDTADDIINETLTLINPQDASDDTQDHSHPSFDDPAW